MASALTPTTWTIAALLQWTADFFARKAVDEPRLSAELLLAHALGCSRMSLYTQYDRIPGDSQLSAFRAAVKQRADHVPVAYLIGKAWFFSLEFTVSRDVLIPRPDTETLVEQLIQRVRQTPGWEAPLILDLCTGSGCIAITLAKHLPAASVVATDVSEKALAVAQQNAAAHGVAERIKFVQGDLLAPLADLTPPPRFHAVAANPPYIPSSQIPTLQSEVRDHEPRMALDGGPDGLTFHRRILTESFPNIGTLADVLAPGGLVALEIAYDEAPDAQTLFAAAGYLENIRLVRDAAGHPRCLMATKAP